MAKKKCPMRGLVKVPKTRPTGRIRAMAKAQKCPVFIGKPVAQTGSTTRSRDIKLPALPPGKRMSKKGNLYWETRRNRSDRSRARRL